MASRCIKINEKFACGSLFKKVRIWLGGSLVADKNMELRSIYEISTDLPTLNVVAEVSKDRKLCQSKFLTDFSNEK